MKELKIFTPFHKKTKRDYIGRMIKNKNILHEKSSKI